MDLPIFAQLIRCLQAVKSIDKDVFIVEYVDNDRRKCDPVFHQFDVPLGCALVSCGPAHKFRLNDDGIVCQVDGRAG